MYKFPILSFLIFLPAVGAAIIFFMDREKKNRINKTALTVSFVEITLFLYIYANFIQESWLSQFEEKRLYIKYLGSLYNFGIDGIILVFIFLIVVITFVAVLLSGSVLTEKYKEVLILLLLIESALIGFFCSQNFLALCVFGEIITFCISKIFTTIPKKKISPKKMVGYNFIGTLLFVFAIIFLYFSICTKTGNYTLEISSYYAADLTNASQFWLFLLLFLSFAIKSPIFPFHSWINDTYSKKIPIASLIIGSLYINIGAFCFLKLGLPILPKAAILFGGWVSGLVCMGTLYNGLIALVQSDMMIFFSYLTLSQIGFATLGIFSFNILAIEGSLLHIMNSSLSSGALLITYITLKSRENPIPMISGKKTAIENPKSIWLMIPYLSIMAFPLTGGFVSTLLVLTGLYKSGETIMVLAFLSTTVTTACIIRAFKNFPFDSILNPAHKRKMTRDVAIAISPLIIMILLIGLYPKGVLQTITASVTHLVEQVKIPHAKKESTFEARIFYPKDFLFSAAKSHIHS